LSKKENLVEISQKQNLLFGDSITINHETIRKTSLFLKNVGKKTLGGLVLILHGLKLCTLDSLMIFWVFSFKILFVKRITVETNKNENYF